jgi:hypothetical protein
VKDGIGLQYSARAACTMIFVCSHMGRDVVMLRGRGAGSTGSTLSNARCDTVLLRKNPAFFS